MLPGTTISPATFSFSFETSSTTSPLSTVELFQSGSSRVEETTYLGSLFNLSAKAPLRETLAAAMLAGAILALAAGKSLADDDTEPGWSRHFYDVHVLVSDGSTTSDFTDANLVNAWGVAFNPQAVVWIADNHTGKATLYDGTGKANALVVTIPPAPGETAGSPTGIVFSGGSDFEPLTSPFVLTFA